MDAEGAEEEKKEKKQGRRTSRESSEILRGLMAVPPGKASFSADNCRVRTLPIHLSQKNKTKMLSSLFSLQLSGL